MDRRNQVFRRIFLISMLVIFTLVFPGCGSNIAGTASQGQQTQEAAGDTEAGEGGVSEAPEAEGTSDGINAAGSEAADGQAADEASADESAADAGSDENEKEISVTEIGAIAIGQTEDAKAGTGCTVLVSKDGMAAGLDVRGGGPASRESELLDPLASADSIHAIVLAGGSAYGLGAANGVMDYLEEQDIGYDTGAAKVPLVVQSGLFDLSVGDSAVRPDAEMGYEAARNALESPNYKDGNYGAGCGATVGKIAGMDTCMKTGIGSYAIQIGDLQIGAVVAVNALGDIYDWKTGRKIAGLLKEDKTGFRDTTAYMAQNIAKRDNEFIDNTTIGVVITNAKFSKSQLCKIAGMTHDGYARSIRPIHTTAEGDSIYAVSTGDIEADQDLVGSLAAVVMSEAIKNAVYNAETAYGYPAAADLSFAGAKE